MTDNFHEKANIEVDHLKVILEQSNLGKKSEKEDLVAITEKINVLIKDSELTNKTLKKIPLFNNVGNSLRKDIISKIDQFAICNNKNFNKDLQKDTDLILDKNTEKNENSGRIVVTNYDNNLINSSWISIEQNNAQQLTTPENYIEQPEIKYSFLTQSTPNDFVINMFQLHDKKELQISQDDIKNNEMKHKNSNFQQFIKYTVELMAQNESQFRDKYSQESYIQEINKTYKKNFETYKQNLIQKANKFSERISTTKKHDNETISKKCHACLEDGFFILDTIPEKYNDEEIKFDKDNNSKSQSFEAIQDILVQDSEQNLGAGQKRGLGADSEYDLEDFEKGNLKTASKTIPARKGLKNRSQVHFFEPNEELDLELKIKKILQENNLSEAIYNQDYFNCLCEMTLQHSFHADFLIEYYSHNNLNIDSELILKTKESEKITQMSENKNQEIIKKNDNSISASDQNNSRKDSLKNMDISIEDIKAKIIKNVVEKLKTLASTISEELRMSLKPNNDNKFLTRQDTYDNHFEKNRQSLNQFDEGNILVKFLDLKTNTSVYRILPISFEIIEFMDSINIDYSTSSDEEDSKKDEKIVLPDSYSKNKNTLTLSKASTALKFLYDEILSMNDQKYKVDLWQLLQQILNGKTILLRIQTKIILDKNHNYHFRLKSILKAEIITHYLTLIKTYNSKLYKTYINNIADYLEFFASLSESIDYAKLLVELDLVTTLFDSFSHSNSVKNFRSSLEQDPSSRMQSSLVELLSNIIRFVPSEKKEIVRNLSNIISDQEDLPTEFLRQVVAPLQQNQLIQSFTHQHIKPYYCQSSNVTGFEGLISECKLLNKQKIKLLTEKLPQYKNNNVDFSQYRVVKLATWSSTLKNNFVKSFINKYNGNPQLFVIKLSSNHCMLIFSFAGLNKKEQDLSNFSIKHDERDFCIFSNSAKGCFFYKLKPSVKDNDETDDHFIIVLQQLNYESLQFMHEKLPKVTIPSNYTESPLIDLYPMKPVAPPEGLNYVFPVNITANEMEIFELMPKLTRNDNFNFSLMVNEIQNSEKVSFSYKNFYNREAIVKMKSGITINELSSCIMDPKDNTEHIKFSKSEKTLNQDKGNLEIGNLEFHYNPNSTVQAEVLSDFHQNKETFVTYQVDLDTSVYKVDWNKVKMIEGSNSKKTNLINIIGEEQSNTIFEKIKEILNMRWFDSERYHEWEIVLEKYFNWLNKDISYFISLLDFAEDLPNSNGNNFVDPYQGDNQNIIAFLKLLFIALQNQGDSYTRVYEDVKNVGRKQSQNKISNKKKNFSSTGIGYEGVSTNFNINTLKNNKKNKVDVNEIKEILKMIQTFIKLSKTGGEILYSALCQSSLLPYLETVIRENYHDEENNQDLDNFDDGLFRNCINIVRTLIKNEDLIPLVLNIKDCYKPRQSESLYEIMISVKNQLEVMLKVKNADKSKPLKEKYFEHLSKLIIYIEEKLKSLGLINEESGKLMIEGIIEKPLEISYPILSEDVRIAYCSLKDPKNPKAYNHYYNNEISKGATDDQNRMLRIAKELDTLSTSLPCNHTNAIFCRVDDIRSDILKVLIFGAEGTPYSGGAFIYDVFLDETFPAKPPKVILKTTGSGVVRFNPNLYSTGKVCLSLQGTWRGSATENWNPDVSTLLQVFLSIQSIIMSDYVYFNEPGYEKEINTDAGKKKNVGYSNIVKYANIVHAMTAKIKNPPTEFKDVILRHFFLKKKSIMEEVNKWLKEVNEPADYSGLVKSHNVTLSSKLSPTGNYLKNLKQAIADLQIALDSITIALIKCGILTHKRIFVDPDSYYKKLEIKRENTIKKQAINIEKLIDEQGYNIDVGYEENEQILDGKDMNIDDSKVKDRWSRYIGAMGIDAVKRQASAKVMLVNVGALGVEIAKNIILSGVKLFTMVDFKTVDEQTLSGQFFLDEKDFGKNRAEACRPKLSELNYYVRVDIKTLDVEKTRQLIDLRTLKVQENYDVFVLTECSYLQQLAFSQYCRERGKKLIVADTYGAFGRVLNDFGSKFRVFDKDGEEAPAYFIDEIKPNGDITMVEDMIHKFEDDDYVMIDGVVGMDLIESQVTDTIMQETKQKPEEIDINLKSEATSSINKQIFKLSVINRKIVNIGNLSNKYSKHVRNGIIKLIKIPVDITFKPLYEILISKEHASEANFEYTDFSKMDSQNYLNHCFNSLTNFLDLNENGLVYELPKKYDYQQSKSILDDYKKELGENFNEKKLEEINTERNMLFQMTARGVLPPLNAFLGGVVSQEIIKSITHKFMPIRQGFYIDFSDVIPPYISEMATGKAISDKLIHKSEKAFEIQKQFYGLEILLGSEFQSILANLKVQMVGAGAIGCELLKNFAMLNISTDPNKKGKIYVTDPDIIEVSNLSRQFLFREKHIRMPKSVTAAYSVKNMSKTINVLPLQEKVAPATENIFTDEFISGLDQIANALDNIQARKYIDNRCVKVKKPLLESGTLGPKGHVQVIIPDLTENYGAQSDPHDDGEIPYCTLKMFPESNDHCIEWGRDKFEKLFSSNIKTLEKVLFEYESCNKDIDSFLSKIETKQLVIAIKMMKKWPKNFYDCISFAREKYEKYFLNDVDQLLYAYPLDKTLEGGKLFWTMPKRPPAKLSFDYNEKETYQFISSTSYLVASCFGILYNLNEKPSIKIDKTNHMENKKYFSNKESLRKDDTMAYIGKFSNNIKVKEFKISDEKVKKMNEALDKQNEDKNKEKSIENSLIEDSVSKSNSDVNPDFSPPKVIDQNQQVKLGDLIKKADIDEMLQFSEIYNMNGLEDVGEGMDVVYKKLPLKKNTFFNEDFFTSISTQDNLDTKLLKEMDEKDLVYILDLACNAIGKKNISKLSPQLFEKDDDENFHIDFISSVSNLRAKSYNIEKTEWLQVKLKAGKIVPALATTTACVAGLQALELLKIVELRNIRGVVEKSKLKAEKDIESFKNAFLNLSVPQINFSEPGVPKLYKFSDKAEFTIWDRISVEGKSKSIHSLSEDLLKNYGLHMVDIYHGNKAIFLEKRDKNLTNVHINNLLNLDGGDVELTITFKKNKNDKEIQQNTPLVHVKL